MKKFEYKLKINIDTEILNELGKHGWELVAVVYNLGGFLYYFKREIL